MQIFWPLPRQEGPRGRRSIDATQQQGSVHATSAPRTVSSGPPRPWLQTFLAQDAWWDHETSLGTVQGSSVTSGTFAYFMIRLGRMYGNILVLGMAELLQWFQCTWHHWRISSNDYWLLMSRPIWFTVSQPWCRDNFCEIGHCMLNLFSREIHDFLWISTGLVTWFHFEDSLASSGLCCQNNTQDSCKTQTLVID